MEFSRPTKLVARKSVIGLENIEITSNADGSRTTRRRHKTQAKKSVSGNYSRETLNPVSSNSFLFENKHDFQRYKTNFANRKISGTFYFKEEEIDKIASRKLCLIEGYINFWKWKPLIECTQPYLELVTRILYSNMELINDPWGVKTYFGHNEIIITMDTITQVLSIPQEGHKFYPFKEFSESMETFFEYKQWFGAVKSKDYVSDTILPVVQWVAYLFVNNILTLKKDVKNVLEMNSIFCLKHLLSKDLELNIPFIIINHMRKAASSKTSSLPYPHILALILVHYDIHFSSGKEVYQTPINLVQNFVQKGGSNKKFGGIRIQRIMSMNGYITLEPKWINTLIMKDILRMKQD